MPVTKIKTRWTSGNLQFYSAAVDPILTIKEDSGDVEFGTGQTFAGQRFVEKTQPLAAATVSNLGVPFFIAPAPCKVISAYEVHSVCGATTGALNLLKCGSGIAPGAGTSVLANGTGFNISANATADMAISMNATNSTGLSYLAAGERLSVKADVCTALANAVVAVTMEWL